MSGVCRWQAEGRIGEREKASRCGLGVRRKRFPFSAWLAAKTESAGEGRYEYGGGAREMYSGGGGTFD